MQPLLVHFLYHTPIQKAKGNWQWKSGQTNRISAILFALVGAYATSQHFERLLHWVRRLVSMEVPPVVVVQRFLEVVIDKVDQQRSYRSDVSFYHHCQQMAHCLSHSLLFLGGIHVYDVLIDHWPQIPIPNKSLTSFFSTLIRTNVFCLHVLSLALTAFLRNLNNVL